MLDLGAYLAGVAQLAAIAAALLFGATRVRSAALPTWSGAPARLAEAVLALSTFLVICQLLGLLGQFHQLPLLTLSIAVGLGLAVLAPRITSQGPRLPKRILPRVALGRARLGPRSGRHPSDRTRGQQAPGRHPSDRTRGQETSESSADKTNPERSPWGGHRIQLALALAATTLAFAHWSIPALEALDRGIYGFDSQWYHLPFAARFAETGAIWDLHHTSPVLLSWFYPANSELLHAAGMVVFERDLLSPVLNLAWLALALLAAWCLGRPWGVGGLSVLGVFVVFDAGVFADQAGDARNDAMAAALLLAAGALLAQRPPWAALGGLAAGIALGTRLTSLAPVAALTAGIAWISRRGHQLRVLGVWVAALAVTGGLWYLRNVVATGSPLPQLRTLGPLGLPGPDQPLGGRPSFSVAHYATDPAIWTEWFAPALRDALGALWPLLLALALGGALLAIVRGPSPAIRMLGAVAAVAAVAYVFTPVTASGPEGEPIGFGPNLRYLAPALALGLALLPIGLRRWGGRPAALATAALAAVAVAVATEPARWQGGRAAAVALVAAIAVLLAAAVTAQLRRRGGRRRPAVAGLVAGIALVIAGGYFEQRRYLEQRYSDPAAAIDSPGLPEVFLWARDVRDARIATTATRQYPLYGTALSNHVQFVGRTGPAGAFVRAASCEEWREAVNDGDYDYLVTALDRIEPGGPAVPPERAWTSGSPNADEIVRDGPASVFRLTGRLDPDRCP